jgi:hypothetical protein
LLNVSVYPNKLMSAEDVIGNDYTHVILATGARWCDDGVGRERWRPIPGHDRPS